MDPDRPATRGGLVGLAARWRDDSNEKDSFLLLLLLHSISFLPRLSYSCSFAVSRKSLIFIPLFLFSCLHVLSFFLLCAVFPLSFYLVSVNRSVVQDLVITPESVWLLADCCRGTVLAWCWATLTGCWLYWPKHCIVSVWKCSLSPLQHTPSTLCFRVRDLNPSVIPLSSVLQTEGFWWEGGGGSRGLGTKLPLWLWLT